MKLSYLQSIDPCDPLPKLGRKVEPKKPDTDPFAHIKAFEIGEHSIKPHWFGVDLAISTAVKAAAAHVGTDTFLKAMSSATPPTVSFADVGEMVEKKAPAAATLRDADVAFRAAVSRVGNDAASKVWYAVVNGFAEQQPNATRPWSPHWRR